MTGGVFGGAGGVSIGTLPGAFGELPQAAMMRAAPASASDAGRVRRPISGTHPPAVPLNVTLDVARDQSFADFADDVDRLVLRFVIRPSLHFREQAGRDELPSGKNQQDAEEEKRPVPDRLVPEEPHP